MLRSVVSGKSIVKTASALAAASLLAVSGMSANANTPQTVTVTIAGLENTNGDIAGCLWRRGDEGFPNCAKGSPMQRQKAPASTGSLTFTDVPPGDYAITVFHDEEQLGKPKTNFLGMPTSPIGLSNNPEIGMANRPTFDKARVTVPPAEPIVIRPRSVF